MPVAAIAGKPRHGQCQNGSQPLAAGGNQVVGNLRNQCNLRSGTRQDGGVDTLHVLGDELDEPVDGGRRAALEWDNDSQKSDSELKGRTSIETLC